MVPTADSPTPPPPAPTLAQASLPRFERVSSGPIGQDVGQAVAPTWADYDNDGDIDLFITHLRGHPNALYRNDGPQGFTRILDTPPALIRGENVGAGWGDYDNDGLPDLFVNDFNYGTRLYRNLGNGSFAEPMDLIAAGGVTGAHCGGWADFDGDGRLDLLTTYGGGANQAPEQLWHQRPDGTFTPVQQGPVVSSAGFTLGGGWGDYDGDRLPDLYIGNGWNEVGFLFHNLGMGRFETVTQPPFDSQDPSSGPVAWADYDNDGDLDLFVGHAEQYLPALYRNEGSGRFTRITNSALVAQGSAVVGAVWGDYDNDGWLDLYIANRGTQNQLFRNLGDGQFTRVTNDPVVGAARASNGCAWGDYNNDGFLDLAVANWDEQPSDLFRNLGNANAWLKVQCRGHTSNASGIGAKVRVLARIGGAALWQMREINSGDGWGSPELIAHFGLGDASTVERLVVEWPSGITQEVTGAALRQRITVTEPPPALLAILPNGGVFTNSTLVTLESRVAATALFYTLDGSDPSLDSLLYAGPFLLRRTTTVKARLFLNGFPASETLTAHFQADPGVTILPQGAAFTNRIDVTLVTRLPQTILRYTVDGTPPTLESPVYTNPVPITAHTTVTTVAFFNDFPVSEAVSALFQRVYVFGNDGIPDAWRETYFGAEFRFDPRAHQSSDPDQDGSDNRQEFLSGSDPLDRASGFRVGVRALPEIGFPTLPGRTYRVLRRRSLDDPSPEVIHEVVAIGERTRFIDESADATPQPSFYLVEPVPSPGGAQGASDQLK